MAIMITRSIDGSGNVTAQEVKSLSRVAILRRGLDCAWELKRRKEAMEKAFEESRENRELLKCK